MTKLVKCVIIGGMTNPSSIIAVGSETADLLGGEVRIRTNANVMTTGELNDGATVDIDIVYDPDLGRYVAESVNVRRGGNGTEVTARLIREVRVQDAIVSIAMSDLIEVLSSDEDEDYITVSSGHDWLAKVKPVRERSASDDALRDAAVIYTIARLGNWPPLATVAKHLGVSQSTATRLVADARARGLFFDHG
ncbi:hypothetical protein D9V29_11830 [Mycetocola manganoxydans]|uniref:Uncharacterized protein n=1 Tax=Mycetocola manganoxydans TaxID=699879 RepID=A0A3L6ZNC7_9MICO|nr:hypothetical protein [Mycetocola manganoxydans]RLP69404.1 hypothetical protein D9V29_11830 [Mycetocola manganoxydans]GHD50690.1 hypothetical protein GCM10008097_24900 [Mycetocola manganoxydans]